MDICELEATLLYRESSRTDRATERNPVLEGEVGMRIHVVKGRKNWNTARFYEM